MFGGDSEANFSPFDWSIYYDTGGAGNSYAKQVNLPTNNPQYLTHRPDQFGVVRQMLHVRNGTYYLGPGNPGNTSVFDGLIAYGGATATLGSGGTSGSYNQGAAGCAGGADSGGGGGAGQAGQSGWYAAPSSSCGCRRSDGLLDSGYSLGNRWIPPRQGCQKARLGIRSVLRPHPGSDRWTSPLPGVFGRVAASTPG